MAKKQVFIIVCDKCKTEGTDPKKFHHVVVSDIHDPNVKSTGKRAPILSEKDLCNGCLGAPGVNVEP